MTVTGPGKSKSTRS